MGILNSKITDEVLEEGSISFPGARVLIVDDEPMNLIVSAGMFKRYGLVVSTCESGQQAIELCRDNDYDIIFMDHMMPVMDGVEAMKRIRSDQNRIKNQVPIIAFTANAVSSAKEMFRKEGFDGFVGKPVDRVELERVLRRLLPETLVSVETVKPMSVVSAEMPAPASGQKTVIDKLAAIGVDTGKGLYYSQNDREFYNTLLETYARESAEKKRIMEEALDSGDLESYAIQVHSIKSTSKMIGAMHLSESARLLEAAAKEGDRSYIDINHAPMLTVYERVVSTIRPEGVAKTADTGTADEDVLEFEPEGGQP